MSAAFFRPSAPAVLTLFALLSAAAGFAVFAVLITAVFSILIIDTVPQLAMHPLLIRYIPASFNSIILKEV
jgi:hypothetical protein